MLLVSLSGINSAGEANSLDTAIITESFDANITTQANDTCLVWVNNEIALFYSEYSAQKNRDIYFVQSRDGHTWSEPFTIVDSEYDEYSPSVCHVDNRTFVTFIRAEYQQTAYPPVCTHLLLTSGVDFINWVAPMEILNNSDSVPIAEMLWYYINDGEIFYFNNEYFLVYVLNYEGLAYSDIYLRQSNDGETWCNEISINSTPELSEIPEVSATMTEDAAIIVFSGEPDGYGYILKSQDMRNWTQPIKYGHGSSPTLIVFNNHYCIVNTAGIWLSDDLVNWTHVLNKSYEQPSAVQMDDGRIMVAYVKDGDIWIDVVDLGLGEEDNCDDCVFWAIGNFFVENALVAIPAIAVAVGTSVFVVYLLKRRRTS